MAGRGTPSFAEPLTTHVFFLPTCTHHTHLGFPTCTTCYISTTSLPHCLLHTRSHTRLPVHTAPSIRLLTLYTHCLHTAHHTFSCTHCTPAHTAYPVLPFRLLPHLTHCLCHSCAALPRARLARRALRLPCRLATPHSSRLPHSLCLHCITHGYACHCTHFSPHSPTIPSPFLPLHSPLTHCTHSLHCTCLDSGHTAPASFFSFNPRARWLATTTRAQPASVHLALPTSRRLAATGNS